MSKLPELPTYDFTVSMIGPDGRLYENTTVEAAYFQETGQYTQFKNATHVVVDAFKTDSVLRIKRSEGTVDVV